MFLDEVQFHCQKHPQPVRDLPRMLRAFPSGSRQNHEKPLLSVYVYGSELVGTVTYELVSLDPLRCWNWFWNALDGSDRWCSRTWWPALGLAMELQLQTVDAGYQSIDPPGWGVV